MKTALKILLLVGVFGYIVFAITNLAHPTEEVTCDSVSVSICDSVPSDCITIDYIYGILRRHKIAVEGKKFSEIDLPMIDSLIMENPYIDHVRSHFTATGTLYIQVTPQHPILHIMAQNGEDYYLDCKGTVMPVDTVKADLCVATGNISQKFARERLIPLAKYINEDKFWNRQIEQIHVVADYDIEMIPRVGKHIIMLGDARNYTDQLERLLLFYREGLPVVGWNKYKAINLAFDGQIVGIK